MFGEQQIEGVDARSLRISPAVELTYAVFDGLAAVATDPAGDRATSPAATAASTRTAPTSARPRASATSPRCSPTSTSRGLVELGERSGLAEDPAYATFAGDFRSLDALGLEISEADDLLSTDARLLLREAAAPGGDDDACADATDLRLTSPPND